MTEAEREGAWYGAKLGVAIAMALITVHLASLLLPGLGAGAAQLLLLLPTIALWPASLVLAGMHERLSVDMVVLVLVLVVVNGLWRAFLGHAGLLWWRWKADGN
jgi:hypothetical protein